MELIPNLIGLQQTWMFALSSGEKEEVKWLMACLMSPYSMDGYIDSMSRDIIVTSLQQRFDFARVCFRSDAWLMVDLE